MTGTRELGAEAAVRDDAARDVVRLWVAVDVDGWMQGDPFPVSLSNALDRLVAAHGLTP